MPIPSSNIPQRAYGKIEPEPQLSKDDNGPKVAETRKGSTTRRIAGSAVLGLNGSSFLSSSLSDVKILVSPSRHPDITALQSSTLAEPSSPSIVDGITFDTFRQGKPAKAVGYGSLLIVKHNAQQLAFKWLGKVADGDELLVQVGFLVINFTSVINGHE